MSDKAVISIIVAVVAGFAVGLGISATFMNTKFARVSHRIEKAEQDLKWIQFQSRRREPMSVRVTIESLGIDRTYPTVLDALTDLDEQVERDGENGPKVWRLKKARQQIIELDVRVMHVRPQVSEDTD